MPVRVTAIESTDLFVGTEDQPRQVIRVGLSSSDSAKGALAVEGTGVRTPDRVWVKPWSGDLTVEVGVVADGPAGAQLPVRVTVDGALAGGAAEGAITVAEPGWTMVMVSHFHYDPVWWNTQAAYTSEWDRLDFDGSPRGGRQEDGFTLVRAHLDMARLDPDYHFVLAELDYLKPFWDVHPERREELRRLLAEGRLELMGGTYNEPNSNLTAAETSVRNLILGIGFQKHVLGGDPATAWQLDVFGHDPQFPGMAAAAGLTSSSWARGPFHQWGPLRVTWDKPHSVTGTMQFPAEFEWVSPSGRGVLTAYMADHYSSGWELDSAADLAQAEEKAHWLFSRLKNVAAAKAVLLPVGTDYSPPNQWVTQIHREWNSRYVWPRFVSGLPRDFFALVRAELEASGRRPSPQTRDMNPVYTGKDVSFIDTKQAHRAGEHLLMDAEKFATLATLLGGRYPDAAIDKAWRQLAYGAHHDAVTGSESDQVYLDLLTGWREAHDLAADVRDRSIAHLTSYVDTRGDGIPVTVYNGLSWSRTDVVRAEVEFATPGTFGLVAVDDAGVRSPAVVEAADRYDDGSLRRAVVSLLARDVPGVGYLTVHLVPTDDAPEWTDVDGLGAGNEFFRIEANPYQGGGLSSIVELASGRELVTAGEVANELVVYAEYPAHPTFHEGPWHLVPSGARAGSRDVAATVCAQRSPAAERLVVTGEIGPVRYTQTVTLWSGVDRLDCRTRFDDFTGSDELVRVRFPCPVPGALPVSEVGNAAIGRGFGLIDVDSAEFPWTLDNPAYTWIALSSTAKVRVNAGEEPAVRAIAVAEIVCPDETDHGRVRGLATALVGVGVTSTVSSAGGSRYGLLDVDSNLPDVRLVVGGPSRSSFAAAVLEIADPAYIDELSRQLAESGRARVWVPAPKRLVEVWQPGADLRGADALDVLIIDGSDDAALDAEIAAVVADLGDAVIDVEQRVAVASATAVFEDRTVGLANRGIPGFAVTSDGALNLSLIRSCTGWPSGVWIDPPKRTAPDGSAFQLQHWTHEFDYALAVGDGDWRAAGLVAQGHGFGFPLSAVVGTPHDGTLPSASTLVEVDPSPDFVLTTLKPTGNPLADGSGVAVDPSRSITVRGFESAGRQVEATIRLPLAGEQPRSVSLLEVDEAEPSVDVRSGPDGTLRLRVGAADIATAVLEPDRSRDGWPESTGDGPALGAEAEPVQPVYTRYWMHNAGPAPLGYEPVAVHLHPSRLRYDGEPVGLRVTVASDVVDAEREGTVHLDLPDGWLAKPAELIYSLAPGGYAEYDVTVRPTGDVADGVYAVSARITDSGQEFADVTHVTVGTVEPGPLLDLSLDTTPVVAAPGGRAVATGTLRNASASAALVRVWAVSPYGTWDAVGPREQAVDVPAGRTATVTVDVTPPLDAPPSSTWLLLKAGWAGQLLYSEAVQVRVEGGPSGGGAR